MPSEEEIKVTELPLLQQEELINQLRSDFSDRSQQVAHSMTINDINSFLANLQELSKEYPQQILRTWSQELEEDMDSFDLNKISKKLASFNEMVDQLSL